MAEMTALKRIFLLDTRFRNEEFDPPTNGFNMTVTDFETATNVTSEKARCSISVRNMPDSGFDEALAYIENRAAAHGLETKRMEIGYFYGKREGQLIRMLCQLAGSKQAVSVPYGTEASVLLPENGRPRYGGLETSHMLIQSANILPWNSWKKVKLSTGI